MRLVSAFLVDRDAGFTALIPNIIMGFVTAAFFQTSSWIRADIENFFAPGGGQALIAACRISLRRAAGANLFTSRIN